METVHPAPTAFVAGVSVADLIVAGPSAVSFLFGLFLAFALHVLLSYLVKL